MGQDWVDPSARVTYMRGKGTVVRNGELFGNRQTLLGRDDSAVEEREACEAAAALRDM